MNFVRVSSSSVLIAILYGWSCQLGAALCPACTPVLVPTLGEQLADSDSAFLVKLVSTRKTNLKNGKSARTTLSILQIEFDIEKKYKKGEKLVLAKVVTGKVGDLFFLSGTRKKETDPVAWSKLQAISRSAYNYVTQAPPIDAPNAERLPYYLNFLENPDSTIAFDAYAEFTKAPYQDVAALRKILPRKKLRKWLTNTKTIPARIGLYGLMLGICGTKEDIGFMENQITVLRTNFNVGVDGVISGYLLLVGEKGLDLIDKEKLTNKKTSAAQAYSTMQALRIVWSYGKDRIPRNRLKKSMRLLLDRKDIAEFAIGDLSRWQDWSVQNRLMQMFRSKDFGTKGIRTAIVRYMIASTKDIPEGTEPTSLKYVQSGKKFLAELKKLDPTTYRRAIRFGF